MKQNRLIFILAHSVGWILFFSLMIAFISGFPGSGETIAARIISPFFLLFCFIYVFVFYFNSYVLIPVFYLKKKYLPYFLIILILFAGVYFFKPYDNLLAQDPYPAQKMDISPILPHREPVRTDIISIVLFVAIWSLSTAMSTIRQWRITEQRATRAEAC